jgi:hypothetical protein
MINITTKVTIIFLLFNIILFINMFRKLKEPITVTCDPTANNDEAAISRCLEIKKRKFQCLSPNCNKEINGIFNVHLTGRNNPLDEWNQNLAAYCCRRCRNTGGCECDPTCASHSYPHETPIHGRNNSGYCAENYNESFTSKVKEGFEATDHGDLYHNSIIPAATNTGYECEGGLIDPANCDCYMQGEGSIEDGAFTNEPDSPHATNCGEYRFFKCYNDPSCVTRLNSIRMNTFTDRNGSLIKEPKDRIIWGKNVVNIIADPIFNGEEWTNWVDDNGETHLYNHARAGSNLGPMDTWDEQEGDADCQPQVQGYLASFDGRGWCEDICNKASNMTAGENTKLAWADRPDLLEDLDDDGEAGLNSRPNPCAQSDVLWASKFFCQSCNMYDQDGGWVGSWDAAEAPYKCHDNADISYSTQVTNKYKWEYVDANGGDAAQDFLNNEIDGNYTQHGSIISGDSHMPATTWNKDRDLSHLQYYCRAACGQELSDKCHNPDGPTHGDMNKIRNHCRAICKKRLPCPNFIKRLASLQSSDDGEEYGDADWARNAPAFSDHSIPPCPQTEYDRSIYPDITGSCKEDGSSLTWEELRSDTFGLGAN